GTVVVGKILDLAGNVDVRQAAVALDQGFQKKVDLRYGQDAHPKPSSLSAASTAGPAALSAEKRGSAKTAPYFSVICARSMELDDTPPENRTGSAPYCSLSAVHN